jgi:Mrp family chromosome partitioning ATPase
MGAPLRFTKGEGGDDGDSIEDRVIVITSGKGGVGKTTASANLGMSIARCGPSTVAGDG